MLKKSVNNLGTKLYNLLPNHLKNLEDLKPFKKQVKAFLLQQSFYLIEEYLSYVQVQYPEWEVGIWKRILVATKLIK
jgi:hypothetical protein